MVVVDVNVLLASFRTGTQHHRQAHQWLGRAIAGVEPIGLPDETLMGFLRLVTNHRVYPVPTPPEEALTFCDAVMAGRAVHRVAAGAEHWQHFRALVRDLNLRAKDIPDAHLAALALERGASLATFDRGFRRFPGLQVVIPGESEPVS